MTYHPNRAIIKMHGLVSVVKKDVQHTCELFTSTIKLLISAPRISKLESKLLDRFLPNLHTYYNHALTLGSTIASFQDISNKSSCS